MPGADDMNRSQDCQGKKPPHARHLTRRGGEEEGAEVEVGEPPPPPPIVTSPVPAHTAHRRWMRMRLLNSQAPRAKTATGTAAPTQISGPGVYGERAGQAVVVEAGEAAPRRRQGRGRA